MMHNAYFTLGRLTFVMQQADWPGFENRECALRFLSVGEQSVSRPIAITDRGRLLCVGVKLECALTACHVPIEQYLLGIADPRSVLCRGRIICEDSVP
jgi:hypothetical protein